MVPFGVDQPFWASRVRETGVGTYIHRKSLTVEKLDRAMRQVLSAPSYGAAAREVSAYIKPEPGVAKAVDVISRISERRA